MAQVDLRRGALEYVRLNATAAGRAAERTPPGGGSPIVFLHEGLGSIELWRGFPAEVSTATERAAVVYDRHGHGRSAAGPGRRTPHYMHDEALEVLPELLEALRIHDPILVGHSDGASIALIYAGARLGPVAALVLLAPHVFVEDRSIQGIEAARRTYLTSDLPQRMAKYHADADEMFWGWNDVWLSPEFRSWNIEEYLPPIECPVLVVQGADDEYGTVAQVDAIERGVSSDEFERLVLPGCRHAPYVDRPHETVEAVTRFVNEQT